MCLRSTPVHYQGCIIITCVLSSPCNYSPVCRYSQKTHVSIIFLSPSSSFYLHLLIINFCLTFFHSFFTSYLSVFTCFQLLLDFVPHFLSFPVSHYLTIHFTKVAFHLFTCSSHLCYLQSSLTTLSLQFVPFRLNFFSCTSLSLRFLSFPPPFSSPQPRVPPFLFTCALVPLTCVLLQVDRVIEGAVISKVAVLAEGYLDTAEAYLDRVLPRGKGDRRQSCM